MVWDHKDLEPRIFHKVHITRAYYDALQYTLDRKYPDRNLAQYNGRNHDVLSDKLNILKSSQHPNNYEVQVGDDEDEINSLFPFTLSYLDLSTFELKNKSDRFPLPLFLRDGYGHISDLISSFPQNSKGSVIVSGQPGTGENPIHLSCSI